MTNFIKTGWDDFDLEEFLYDISIVSFTVMFISCAVIASNAAYLYVTTGAF